MVVPVNISHRTSPSGEDVRPGIDLVAAGLLGGHVGDRADDVASHRQPQVALRFVVIRLRRDVSGRVDPGETEVQENDAPVRAQHDVRGFDVAMDDPDVVRRGERVGSLRRDPKHLAVRDPAGASQVALQRDPANELDGRIRSTRRELERLAPLRQEQRIGELANFVYRADPAMVEARRSSSFPQETLPVVGIPGKMRVEELDRDRALQGRIPRFPHRSHAAGTERGG